MTERQNSEYQILIESGAFPTASTSLTFDVILRAEDLGVEKQ